MAAYSRDATVATVTAFYEFLTRLPRLPVSQIRRAPAEGWPELSGAYLAPLGKSPAVLDLLRHLPYIANDGNGCAQIAPWTQVISYSERTVKWVFDTGKVKGLLEPVGAGTIPDHVAVLTEGGRYGSWLLLDTKAGKYRRWQSNFSFTAISTFHLLFFYKH
jgi:hypothetical protein